jgi:hypothetical protein
MMRRSGEIRVSFLVSISFILSPSIVVRRGQ